MNQEIKTVIYPVKDVDKAKTLFKNLLGVEPYINQPYYVGFRIGTQEIGLDPNGHREGMTPYFHVDDIGQSLKSLVAAGVPVIQDIKDVGGGKMITSLKDAEGNIIGLIQEP
jgi:predicted enzyme related to lactoylglutathione lyase